MKTLNKYVSPVNELVYRRYGYMLKPG